MPNPSVEKTFCTTTEAARLLGVSVATAQLWTETGLLTAWKTDGGHRRILRESVDRQLYRNSAASANPPATAAATPAEPTPAPAAAQRPLRMVVVEDDAALLRLYGVHIRAWSFPTELHLFDNAFAALLKVGRDAPDVLVLDLHMPDLDGFALLRMLSNAPEAKATRIVVVSGLDAAAITLRGGVPSDIEVLTKPIPFDRLETISRDVLLRRSPLPTPIL